MVHAPKSGSVGSCREPQHSQQLSLQNAARAAPPTSAVHPSHPPGWQAHRLLAMSRALLAVALVASLSLGSCAPWVYSKQGFGAFIA